ncbi:MAG: hypothetical protein E3J35_02445 [Methanomassiliicoccales archaeon]|nr:MAG: hypothetical protein E3J35_02445 [Methanomassiliicoccales archaeon]
MKLEEKQPQYNLDQKKLFLTEYEMGLDTMMHLETVAWQVGSILAVISFMLMALSPKEIYPYVAIASLASCTIWILYSLRLKEIYDKKDGRIKDLEIILEFRQHTISAESKGIIHRATLVISLMVGLTLSWMFLLLGTGYIIFGAVFGVVGVMISLSIWIRRIRISRSGRE